MLKILNKYSLTHAFFLVLLPILYFLPILPPPRSFFFSYFFPFLFILYSSFLPPLFSCPPLTIDHFLFLIPYHQLFLPPLFIFLPSSSSYFPANNHSLFLESSLPFVSFHSLNFFYIHPLFLLLFFDSSFLHFFFDTPFLLFFFPTLYFPSYASPPSSLFFLLQFLLRIFYSLTSLLSSVFSSPLLSLFPPSCTSLRIA